MLSTGHSGFVHAPVTKVIVSAVVLTTVFGSIIGSQSRLTLHVDAILHSYQFWRLFTHHFVFTTPGELLFGIVLIYFFRQFERQLGSSRFCAHVLISSSLYTVFLFCLQIWASYSQSTDNNTQDSDSHHRHHSIHHDNDLSESGFQRILSVMAIKFLTLTPASGPYSLIFMGVVQFAFETPKIYHFQLLGLIHLSDKTVPYIVVSQLIMSNPPASLLSACVAALAALVCRLPPLANSVDIPQPIVQASTTHILPWLGTTPRAPSAAARRQRAAARYARVTAAVNGLLEAGARPHPNAPPISTAVAGATQQDRRRQQQQLQQQQAQQTQQQRTQHSNDDEVDDDDDDDPILDPSRFRSNTMDAMSSPAVISVDNVNTLVSMGFSRNDAISALRRTHDNVHAATDVLLQTSGNT